MIELYSRLVDALQSGSIWAPTLARLVVGLMFALSGFSKLTNPKHHEQMVETLDEAGIAAPRVQSWLVSGCELVFGLCLAAGLLTLVSAAVLAVICVVALVTVALKKLEGVTLAARVSSLLYTPETLLLALLAVVALSGPGVLSADVALGLYR